MSRKIKINVTPSQYNKLEMLRQKEGAASVSDVVMEAVQAAPNHSVKRENLIDAAIEAVKARVDKELSTIGTTGDSIEYIQDQLSNREDEVFGALYLNGDNKLVKVQEWGHTKTDGCNVSSQSVVRSVLETNATNVLFYQNFPRVNSEEFTGGEVQNLQDVSLSDFRRVSDLGKSLNLVGVNVFDSLHFNGSQIASFGETIDKAKENEVESEVSR